MPLLDTLILTGNNLQELADIEPLSTVKTLTMLSFLHNPVCAKPNYRLYVVHKFPNLKVLDFRKVKKQERDAAEALYASKKGKDQMKEIKKKAKTFVPGAPLGVDATNSTKTNPSGLSAEQIKSIKAAIARATTFDEIERLNHMLRSGQVPGKDGEIPPNTGSQAYNPMEVEEDD